MSELKICIDSNEASSRHDILNLLRLSGVVVNIQKLTVCDYVISDRVGVERKDVNDLVSSLKDGRLFNQVKAMADVYERPILILEGRLSNAFRRSAMKPSAIYGALSSVALDFGLGIIPTEDSESTATLLQRLCYREQAEEQRAIQLRSVDRSLPLSKQQLFLLSGFPQIGSILGDSLLRKFDSPIKVIQELAESKIYYSSSGKTKKLIGPLTEVKGIGPTIVEYAKNLLNSSYNQACVDELDS
jgi:Fanconi anemia group M protein